MASLPPHEMDERLGYRVQRTEASVQLMEGVELWHAQGPSVFQTPYAEFVEVLRELALPKGAHIVDLGAAYGRLGIVIAALKMDLKFTGLEISTERVNEGRRVYSSLGLDPAQLKVADLADERFKIPEAQAYFVYDFGTREAVQKVLIDLKYLAARGVAFELVGRGRRSRDLIEREHPWLSQVHSARHRGNFSIYRP